MASAAKDSSAEKEANELTLSLYTKLDLLENEAHLGNDGCIYGENLVSREMLARRKRDIDPSDAFYCFSGVTANVGTGYCVGTAGGALAGTYFGLMERIKGGAVKALTWRLFGTSMFHAGSKYAVMYGNRLGAAAFAVGVVEGLLREAALRQGREQYRFKDFNESDLPFYLTDSRKLTPLAALITIPMMRYRRPLPTIVLSTALMMAGTAVYSHSFTPESYFDIRKGWDTPRDANI
eukprot:TRINITY_DN8439_c0_g5_i1.p1 TRINITY_DN8439_c0_g5~~TRINITY_DN8439_c0_g5_i1.p1  ORF type:complete len:257 (+),score=62.00 TRINITY_DN8439_c0_g5_i1:65-772(+)